ncbi:MAG: hypothetical protein HYZ34_11685 [Ignavibacteriae bacterium]|nr:hypothetical protein [Ignavibacteriota bacterium]
MKYSSIKRKYKNQWVLLECLRTKEDLTIVEANVLAHSKRKEDLYRKEAKYALLTELPLAIEYTGEYPHNITIVF